MNESVEYADGANTKAVKEDLLGGYNKGILKVSGVGVLTETLDAGDYEYHVTHQGKKHHLFTFIVLHLVCCLFTVYCHLVFLHVVNLCCFLLCSP